MPRHAIPSNVIDLDLNELAEGKVVVNGFDMSTVVGCDLSLSTDIDTSGHRTTVLRVSIPAAIAARVEGQVEVDEESAAGLKALGWTPPKGD